MILACHESVTLFKSNRSALSRQHNNVNYLGEMIDRLFVVNQIDLHTNASIRLILDEGLDEVLAMLEHPLQDAVYRRDDESIG